jgi:hypothetical protein
MLHRPYGGEREIINEELEASYTYVCCGGGPVAKFHGEPVSRAGQGNQGQDYRLLVS